MTEISSVDKIVKLNDGFFYQCYQKCDSEDCSIACGFNNCDTADCNEKALKYTKPMYKVEGNNYDMFLKHMMDPEEHKVYQDGVAYISAEYVWDKIKTNQEAAFVKQLSYLDKTTNPKLDEMILYDTPKGECIKMQPCKDDVWELGMCCDGMGKPIQTYNEEQIPDKMILDSIRQGLFFLQDVFSDEKLQAEIEKYANVVNTFLENNINSRQDIKRVVDEYILNLVNQYNTNTLKSPTYMTVQQTQPTQPTQPIQPIQPTQPIQQTQQPAQPIQYIQPTQQTTQPIQPTQQTTQPTQYIQPTQQTTQPVQQTQPVLYTNTTQIVPDTKPISTPVKLSTIPTNNQVSNNDILPVVNEIMPTFKGEEIQKYKEVIQAYITENNINNPSDVKNVIDKYIKHISQQNVQNVQIINEETPKQNKTNDKIYINYYIVAEVIIAIVLISYVLLRKK